MKYTIYALDMVHDEALYSSDNRDEAVAEYASIIQHFKAGTHGFDMDDLEDGVTVVLEDENQDAISEETFYV